MISLTPGVLGTLCCLLYVVLATAVQDEEVVEWSEVSALI
jgi:hypothetical protein